MYGNWGPTGNREVKAGRVGKGGMVGRTHSEGTQGGNMHIDVQPTV